jgi:hypothetical protein
MEWFWTSHGFNRPFRPNNDNSSLAGVACGGGKFVAVGFEYGPDDVKGLICLSRAGAGGIRRWDHGRSWPRLYCPGLGRFHRVDRLVQLHQFHLDV